MGVACHGVSWAGHGIGVTEVVVAGMLSSVCVLFTLQSAFASGFRVKLYADGCGDRTQERHDTMIAMYHK